MAWKTRVVTVQVKKCLKKQAACLFPVGEAESCKAKLQGTLRFYMFSRDFLDLTRFSSANLTRHPCEPGTVLDSRGTDMSKVPKSPPYNMLTERSPPP